MVGVRHIDGLFNIARGRGAWSSLEVGRDGPPNGEPCSPRRNQHFDLGSCCEGQGRRYTRRMGCSRKFFLPFFAAQASRASSSMASNLSTAGSCGRLSGCRRSPVSARCGAGRGRGRKDFRFVIRIGPFLWSKRSERDAVMRRSQAGCDKGRLLYIVML